MQLFIKVDTGTDNENRYIIHPLIPLWKWVMEQKRQSLSAEKKS